ncbi:MAG: DUF5691 domain-containing protein [Deltaproteobacteria bacterium]|nr:DUF5691 domain-containing protein [Deltaproteobacteria bacterium]
MNALASLAATALIGTERRPPEWPSQDGPLGELLAKITRDQPEKALLQTAGVLATCHLAGWLPTTIGQSTPVALDDVLQAAAAPTLLQTLSGILTDGPTRLQAEAFQKLAAANRTLPHRLLPKALDAGKRSTVLRPHLLPALGHRGTWLAAQNEAWAYAVGGGSESLDDEAWQNGSLDQRKLYLTALRPRDADRARALIAAALTTEGARERATFIECLSTALSLADQDLLETTLTDKSKEARQAALRLLSSLSGSRFMQRMAARLEPCLMMEKKFLRGTVITLEPPAVFVAEWKADLIEEAKPKGLEMGERAWWLLQLVRAVPLKWWEEKTSLKPIELIEWAKKSDWSEALLQGWAAAQSLQQRVEWAEAFLSTQIPQGSSLNVLDLLITLPLAIREKHFLRLLSAADAKQPGSMSALLNRFIDSIPLDSPSLSVDTANTLIQFLKRRVNSGEARHDWLLRTTLVELACIIPPAQFEDCAGGWDITKDDVQPFAEAIARVGIVLDQRKQLHSLGA